MCAYREDRKPSILTLMAVRQTCSWVTLDNCDSSVHGEFKGRLANLGVWGEGFTEKETYEQGAGAEKDFVGRSHVQRQGHKMATQRTWPSMARTEGGLE